MTEENNNLNFDTYRIRENAVFIDLNKEIDKQLIDVEYSLSDITKNMFDYFETLENQNDIKKGLIHMHGLYNGLKNAKKIRILLSNSCYFKPAKNEIIELINDNFKNVA